jgi:hypothetical protein
MRPQKHDPRSTMRARINFCLGAILLGTLLFFGARGLWRALASPQTKIRRQVESMVEGFNGMRTSQVLDGIARDFRDEVADTLRDDLRQVLVYLFVQEVEPSTGEFLWSAEFDPEQLQIALAPEKDRAELELGLRIFRRRAGEPQLMWDARLSGLMIKGDDGWQWTRITKANHSERRRL